MSAPVRNGGSNLLPLSLVVLVMGSAVAVVQLKQRNRDLVTEQHALQAEQAQLQQDRSQLELEQATLGQRNQIDVQARKQFGMVDPADYQIVQDARPAALAATGVQR